MFFGRPADGQQVGREASPTRGEKGSKTLVKDFEEERQKTEGRIKGDHLSNSPRPSPAAAEATRLAIAGGRWWPRAGNPCWPLAGWGSKIA